MVRLLICLFALLLPGQVGADDAIADDAVPVIVTGVVDEQGMVYEPIGTVTTYGQSIKLVAWRQGHGPASTQAFSLQIKLETRTEIEALQAPFRKGQTVRFETTAPITYLGMNESAQMAQAMFGKLIGPVDDDELLAAAQKVWKPEGFFDAELGEFEPHGRLYDHFGQEREWNGKMTVFEVILEPMGPMARERALEMARIAWNERVRIDETIRESVADAVYSSVGVDPGIMLVPADSSEPVPEVTDGNLPPLTREQFKANHNLARISCSAQDYCSLQYVAHDIDWYWSYRATIRRKDNGWSLDEWEFP